MSAPGVTASASKLLENCPTIVGYELVAGRPGGPNNDAVILKTDEGTDLIINAYSGGSMLVTTREEKAWSS